MHQHQNKVKQQQQKAFHRDPEQDPGALPCKTHKRVISMEDYELATHRRQSLRHAFLRRCLC